MLKNETDEHRESVWSVNDRERFAYLSVALFVLGLVLRYREKDAFQTAFDIIKDVGTIGIFAVTGAFFILEGIDIMLGIYERIKKTQHEMGRREGRQEGRQEQIDKIRKRIQAEREKGNLKDVELRKFEELLDDDE